MKFIKGYENRYSVTEDGKVYSHLNGKWLKPGINNSGYFIYNLTPVQIKPQKTFTAHKLVAIAYLGLSENDIINHKDGDKQNNHYSNLEKITQKENVLHSLRTGLRKEGYQLSFDGVNYKYCTVTEVSKIIGLGKSAIYYKVKRQNIRLIKNIHIKPNL